ncbi:MAG TPA: F0F1 ATP synthase subunit A [Longimicrobiaceae bacterium]|nr:F0F1 ATP synthase subunit A [Longimicrobiaceae bacterium]
MFARVGLLAILLGAAATAGAAQEHTTSVEAAVEATRPGEHAPEEEHGFDALHHVMDAREIELPFGVHVSLPPAGSWMVGPVDMTPTKHVVFLGLAGLIVLLVMIPAAQAARRVQGGGAPRRHHNVIEAMVLFLRDQLVMPNIGHGGEKFVPFVVTIFFFILVSNLLGLLPWGATATANISVTAALALLSFVVIEVAGMRALGAKGYLGTIVYIPHGLPKALVPVMALIMTPVELLGKLAKPFALAIRLFANMTAGHVLLLTIISLIFVFGSYAIAVAPLLMAVALTFMELFVAFLQAYVFSLLTSVFIGLIRHAH